MEAGEGGNFAFVEVVIAEEGVITVDDIDDNPVKWKTCVKVVKYILLSLYNNCEKVIGRNRLII